MMTYTIELYKPAYPQKGVKVSVHNGEFSAVRDYLSPSMIQAREFTGSRRAAREFARIIRADYLVERNLRKYNGMKG